MKYVPNILTVFRFILIPFIVYGIFSGNYLVAFVLFTISGLTDIADGFIARKFDLVSNFGKLIDPLADKFTQLSVLATLSFTKCINFIFFIIFFVKDFTLILASIFLYKKQVVVYSKWYGKVATCLLYLSIVSSLILGNFIGPLPSLNIVETSLNFLNRTSTLLYVVASCFTVFAFFMYAFDIYKSRRYKQNSNASA